MGKTIIVSNRLPVKIIRDDDGLKYEPSAGGLATGLGSIYKQGENVWIGWPGLYIKAREEETEVTLGLASENMQPVFLTEKDIHSFYEGFSNSTLWPLFHYFTQTAIYDDEYWNSYVHVNQIFCAEILKIASPDDIIWVHDYQLMLLPEMLREQLPDASIAYFNHIPFPSYEVFRMLPWREEIIHGLLGADLIGYHTYDDMRHFLSCVSRIIGFDHEMGHLKYQGRFVTVDSLPMGIDYDRFAQAAISKDTQKEVKKFYQSVSSQQLILSIDRLDYTKGIPQRLQALDRFLDKFPEFRGKVSLILLVVPSRDTVEHYKTLKEEVELLVGRINGKYGKLNWTPIHYFYRSLPFHKLSALYSMADVALVTPLRDGMNLVCKEFVASKLDKTGVLILSEMAGSAKELSEAILVNPNDENAIVDALYNALTMPEDEQERRNLDMQNKLQRYNIHNWVEVFMERLAFTKDKQKEHTSRNLIGSIKSKLIQSFSKSERRLLLLDYDGTLSPLRPIPSQASPDETLKTLMNNLTKDERNHVVVISGRDRHTLQDWLGDYPIDFVAEHGVWYKENGQDWRMVEDLMQSWKEEIQPILELYVDRTPGSFIEHKEYSLVWHYRKAEMGLGEIRARELITNLQYLTSNMDIHILEGNKVVEIKNAGVNKGKAALRWIGRDEWDFIFAAGDDWTDEDIFKVMPENAYSVKVGMDTTDARFTIKSCDDMRNLLSSMSKEAERTSDIVS